MKKIVSVLLVAIMLCTFSFCAFAVDNTASVNIVETASNEYTVYLGFIDNGKEVCGGSMNLVYNSDKLKLVDYSTDSERCMMLINPDYQNKGNTVRFVFASANALSNGENLATIKFSSSGDKVTLSDFSVSEYRLYDVNSSLIANEKSVSPAISFKALSDKDLEDEDMLFGVGRDIAQVELELYILCQIILGIGWDANKMGKWFWQSNKDRDLVILKNWVTVEK